MANRVRGRRQKRQFYIPLQSVYNRAGERCTPATDEGRLMRDTLIGQTLGQYEIRMLLGKGGMSTVYLAYQSSMDRVVAIKVLPREFLHDDTFLARFKQEVRTIAKLEHLHILPVYDVGEDQGVPYFVMRYLSGGTLSDLIDARLPDMRTVVRLAGQMASALDYAHEHGIIHRDFKPSNVLLDTGGNAYLADFGIARVQEAASMTTDSHVIGTPAYIAPEMVRKGEEITPSVDVYALGVIVYEMLTGDPPYAEDDSMKTLMAHVLEPVPSARDFDPNISPAVDGVLRRCLAKTPRERYTTAGEFVQDLTRAAEGGAPTMAAPHTLSPGQAVSGPALEATRSPAWPDAPPAWPDSVPAYPSPPAPPGSVGVPHRRAYPPYFEREQPPWWQRFGGCLVVLGILLALLVGMVVAAITLTEGDPFSLLNVLTPIVTRQPTPTVTPPPEAGAPAGEAQGADSGAGLSALLGGGSGRLAFASNRDGDYEIYLIDVDGENLIQLTDNDAYDYDPDWSPDGQRIVYVSTLGGDAEIVVMDADGGNRVQLTDNNAKDADPAWSPDGEWIAFSSDRDGDFELYVMRVDGSDVRQLTFNDSDDFGPRWSPDGRQIAYYARQNDDSATDLYVIDVAGGAPRRLTDNNALDQWVDWSPDGGRLGFTSGQGLSGGQRAIVTLDLATGEVEPLTPGEARDDDPAWSPDGEWIAFDSDRGGTGFFDLYLLRVATGEVRQITFEAAHDVAPSWQPMR